MQLGYGYGINMERRGYGEEVLVNGFQLVWDVWGRDSGWGDTVQIPGAAPGSNG